MTSSIFYKFFQLFFSHRFQSKDEERYCYQSLALQREREQKLVLLISIPMHLIGGTLAPLILPSDFLSYIISIHICIGSFQLAMVAIKKIPSHYTVTLSWIFMIGGYSYINYMMLSGQFHENFQAPLAAFLMGLHSTYIILAPFYRRYDFLFPLISLVSIVFSFLLSPLAWVYMVAYFCIDIWAVGYRKYAAYVQLDNFQREYRHRSQVLPANIVGASPFDHNLRNIFPAKNRLGIFISSDWRNYQKLTTELQDGQIAEILGQYYEMCDSLMKDFFPDKGYYLDWIADELFVVIFCEDKAELKRKVNIALKFATHLLLEKNKFFERFHNSQGIDIGITQGMSQIGMMGPGSHLKATALGNVPGRARRLQSFGKKMRIKEGDVDRIIIDMDTFLLVSQPFDIKEYELTEKIEDLADRKIFYLE